MYPITPATAQRTAELAANWIDRVNKVVGSKEAVEAVKAIMRHAAFEAAGRTGDAIPKAAGNTAAAQAQQVGSVLGNIFSELVILFVRGLYIILEPLIDFMIAICKGSSDLLVALKSVFYVSLIFYVGLAIFNPTQFAAINAAVIAAYVALRAKVNGVVAKFQAFRKRNRTVNNLLDCGCRMCMTRWNDTHNPVDESQHKPKRARANECNCRKCMVAWNAAFNERDACTNPDNQIKFASPEEEARFVACLNKTRPAAANVADAFKNPADTAKWAADMRAQIEVVENLVKVQTAAQPPLTTTTAVPQAERPENDSPPAATYPELIKMHIDEMNRLRNTIYNRRVELGCKITAAYTNVQDTTLGPEAFVRLQRFQQAIAQTRMCDGDSVEIELNKLERDIAEWIASLQTQPKIVIMEADAPLLAAAAYADLPDRRAVLIGKLATYVSTARTNNNPAHQQYVDSALTMIKWIVTNAAKGNTAEAASHLASIEHTIAEADWLNEIKI